MNFYENFKVGKNFFNFTCKKAICFNLFATYISLDFLSFALKNLLVKDAALIKMLCC